MDRQIIIYEIDLPVVFIIISNFLQILNPNVNFLFIPTEIVSI